MSANKLAGPLNANSYKITSLANGTVSGDGINKGQLDAAIAGIADDQTATQVPFTPTGSISATDVQGAIAELGVEKANLLSPTFTGTVIVPTPVGTTSAANKSYVDGLVTAAALLTKLLTVDTDASGLNSNTLQGSTLAQVISATTAAIVDTAPGTLDTLNELAAAIGDDPNFAVTMNNLINSKARKTSGVTVGTTATQVFTHNFGTRDVVVSVIEAVSPWEHVVVGVESTTANSVTVRFGSAITEGQYRICVVEATSDVVF